jgi:ubiquinone/menaquinone biosynthesis C-methylase UbiE
MADRASLAREAGIQALRFGWYFGLNRLVGWRSDQLGLRPRYRPTRPAPSEREMLADLAALYRRDARGVAEGLLPPLDDGLGPAAQLQRAGAMLADLPAALGRRQAGDTATAETAATVAEPSGNGTPLPGYYTQDFHYQTGGYLTDRSAELYDVQVETLFLGGAALMRREALRPIAGFMRGRDQRRVALIDVACGTGRFLRDVRLSWPALALAGLDLSAPYLAETRRHLQGLRPAHLIEANAETMPLTDESQDIATSIFLFHELPAEARRAVAAEMARVLKPGGLMVFVDSLQYGDRPSWDGLLEAFPIRFHEPYYEGYAGDDLVAVFAGAGLQLESTWTSFLAKVIVCRKPGA